MTGSKGRRRYATSDRGRDRIVTGRGRPDPLTALFDLVEGLVLRPVQELGLTLGMEEGCSHHLGGLGTGEPACPDGLFGVGKGIEMVPEFQGGPGLARRDPLHRSQQ